MNGRVIDIAIVGGGLAGGLTALAVHRARPDLRIALVESGDMLGGNHRWSWFSSDMSDEGAALLAEFPSAAWEGYDVRFPGYERTLETGYNSLSSVDFDKRLRELLPEGSILAGRTVASLCAHGIVLADGEPVEARAVIDARGITRADDLEGGWQVFMGRHIRTARPHGIDRPIIMDATVEQHDAYRFVYTLPLGPNELFVEDTYYADSPLLDRAVLSARIDAYCADHGWTGEEIGSETGVLPVITGGDFDRFRASQAIPGVATIGARGGLTHPLTSYTLSFAVETALAIAGDADLSGDELAATIDRRARTHWRGTQFYRKLGRMLFGAAKPKERYKVFARFYRMPEPLIERFYAGRSNTLDEAMVLSGKPPVPVLAAMRALATRGNPLVMPS